MKKIMLILTILLLTCACSSNYLKSINLKNLNEKLEKKESFVLYLTNDEGESLKKTLSKVLENNKVNGYYLDTDKLKEDDLKSLKEKFTFDDANIIIFVKEGHEETTLSRISDLYISEKDLEQELKLQSYIK